MSLERVDHGVRKIEMALVVVAWLVTLFVTFMIVTDISMRFLLHRPLPASWEISETLMPYIVMFGLAYTLTLNVHVRVTIVIDRLPTTMRRVCDLFGYLLSFGMCLILTYWSWLRFWESYLIDEMILAAIEIPWWIGKFGMPVAFAMFATRYMILILLTITQTENQKKE